MIDVILLGAGRPAAGAGALPSALKEITPNTRAIDWQIRSFEAIGKPVHFRFMGGYHVEEVISRYPDLSFTVVANWMNRSALHTLLQAPFSGHDALVCYSDTLFRKETVEGLFESEADVAFGVDSKWRGRYQSRSVEDINQAETVSCSEFGPYSTELFEFTGLVRIKSHVVDYLAKVSESEVGETLIDLLLHLRDKGFSLAPVDVQGNWAELNSSVDIAHFILGTKAETLARLEPILRKSHIGRQVSFTTLQWEGSRDTVMDRVREAFGSSRLVVRSSAKAEDGWRFSNAGGFDSVLNVDSTNRTSLVEAVESVINSYGAQRQEDDQILVQEFLQNVQSSGVVLTCGLENASPYYRFNFDDESSSTQSVTGGRTTALRTILLDRTRTSALSDVEPLLVPVLEAVQELEDILEFGRLDIEFAVDKFGKVHIFQVRPITVEHQGYELEIAPRTERLDQQQRFFRSQQSPSPLVRGERTIFSNMSDWNPAEILGIRPKPFALSLYRKLITNDVWAQQRAEFGYRDLRPQPLIVAFFGQPYVDVRASLNSFVPAALSEDDAEILVNAYLKILLANPSAHDKIEFLVAFTTWTPTFEREARERLLPHGVSVDLIYRLGAALKQITSSAFLRLNTDRTSIELLSQRRRNLRSSGLDRLGQSFALLEDCAQLGTLPFAHAARAGFIAASFLKSLVEVGIFSRARSTEFMRSLNTVASEFQRDKGVCAAGTMTHEALVERYGHLRPGTYEITAQAYWENPERYLVCDAVEQEEKCEAFILTSQESSGISAMLQQLGADCSPPEFVKYLKDATEARESVKFEFTKSLSRALDVCVGLAEQWGLSREEMSFIEYADIEQLRLNVMPLATLKRRVQQRKKRYSETLASELPSLIREEADLICFERPTSEPNFVTNKRVDAEVLMMKSDTGQNLFERIVVVPQADPGFDWLFGRGIAGLITKYGGANSHMAIRAAEMGLPAAIGVGEGLYDILGQVRKLELDCGNRVIREMQ